VVTLLLKPLGHAVRDGDLVHAVIKGIAANNVAGRSSTLTAPDALSQAEVIERAWAKAGVDPTTITYIEAHGTATPLGDPIEIEAVDLAFGRVTERRPCCAISSVKSNIGHTWSAAGITGLVKVILALRNGVLFPNVHATRLSPLIDFANSAVTVTRELTVWKPPCGVRRAGISSFGVMGTNVHAVLEEAPHRNVIDDHGGQRPAGRSWIPSRHAEPRRRMNSAALRRRIPPSRAEPPGRPAHAR
jgi:acyl transferase domain-containing protein